MLALNNASECELQYHAEPADVVEFPPGMDWLGFWSEGLEPIDIYGK